LYSKEKGNVVSKSSNVEGLGGQQDDGEYHREEPRSEMMHHLALGYQYEVAQPNLTLSQRREYAHEYCLTLNEYAMQRQLLHERASILATDVTFSTTIRRDNGDLFTTGHQASGMQAFETVTGEFIGYGYYLDANDQVVMGAKLVTGYDPTLPFSDGAIVAFCPVIVNKPDFISEQKATLLENIRSDLNIAMADLPYELRECIVAIDEDAQDQAIENVHFLQRLSLKLQLLFADRAFRQATQAVDYLIEMLSVQLELPQTLDIQTNLYRLNPPNTDPFTIQRTKGRAPKYFYNLDARLIVTTINRHTEVALAGYQRDHLIQIPLSAVTAITPSGH
jgi:hypothetical protein